MKALHQRQLDVLAVAITFAVLVAITAALIKFNSAL